MLTLLKQARAFGLHRGGKPLIIDHGGRDPDSPDKPYMHTYFPGKPMYK